jgi:uncharacterized membrane protein HdeD (DUF308 family)
MVAGTIAIVAGVAGALVNLWAREEFPTRWGGPNIGGGFLQLLFYAAIVAGVTALIVVAVRGRLHKRNGGP